MPYQDEPRAEVEDVGENQENEEAGVDGLTTAVLEARYERDVSVNAWFI